MHKSFLVAQVLFSTSTLIIFVFTLIVILKFSFPYVGRVVIFLFAEVRAIVTIELVFSLLFLMSVVCVLCI
jgi:hypothetical protein